jgi:hypothetical protein
MSLHEARRMNWILGGRGVGAKARKVRLGEKLIGEIEM